MKHLLLLLLGLSLVGCKGSFAGYSGEATKLPNGTQIVFPEGKEKEAEKLRESSMNGGASNVVIITRQPATFISE